MSDINLPQKQLANGLEFGEKIECALNMALRGVDPVTASEEEKDKSKTDHCLQPVWPVFMPQCVECLAKNKHQRILVDKKGNRYRVIK